MQCQLCGCTEGQPGKSKNEPILCPDCRGRVGGREIYIAKIPFPKGGISGGRTFSVPKICVTGSVPAATKQGQILEARDANGQSRIVKIQWKFTGQLVVSLILFWFGALSLIGSLITHAVGAVILIEIVILAVGAILNGTGESKVKKRADSLFYFDGRIR